MGVRVDLVRRSKIRLEEDDKKKTHFLGVRI